MPVDARCRQFNSSTSLASSPFIAFWIVLSDQLSLLLMLLWYFILHIFRFSYCLLSMPTINTDWTAYIFYYCMYSFICIDCTLPIYINIYEICFCSILLYWKMEKLFLENGFQFEFTYDYNGARFVRCKHNFSNCIVTI